MEPLVTEREPLVTERDVELLMLSEDSWVALGAMLGLQAMMPPPELVERDPAELAN